MKHIKQLQLIMLMLAVTVTANVSAVEYTTYYFNNAQGSPIAATNDAGKVIWKKEHTPYGATYGNADDKANRIGFTGHVEEEHFNLVYMQQRWYDPAIGRFYSIDPVGFSEENPTSFNRYAYANNNPYKFVDPDGRSPADQQKIIEKGNEIQKSMERSGDRKPGVTSGIGAFIANLQGYMLCYDQAEVVVRELDQIQTDDEWDFNLVGSPGHYWAEAVPSAVGDSVVKIDTQQQEPAAKTVDKASTKVNPWVDKSANVRDAAPVTPSEEKNN